MGNTPTLDFADTVAKPAAFAAFIRSHEALHRAWFSTEPAPALADPDPIERGNLAQFNFAAPAPRAPQPAPAAPQPAPALRRQRRRSITKLCEAARKAGADRVIVDGVVIMLSPAAAVPAAPAAPANPWDSVLPDEGDAHGPH